MFFKNRRRRSLGTPFCFVCVRHRGSLLRCAPAALVASEPRQGRPWLLRNPLPAARCVARGLQQTSCFAEKRSWKGARQPSLFRWKRFYWRTRRRVAQLGTREPQQGSSACAGPLRRSLSTLALHILIVETCKHPALRPRLTSACLAVVPGGFFSDRSGFPSSNSCRWVVWRPGRRGFRTLFSQQPLSSRGRRVACGSWLICTGARRIHDVIQHKYSRRVPARITFSPHGECLPS